VIDDQGTEPIIELGYGGDAPKTDARVPQVAGGTNTAVQFAASQATLVFLHGDSAHPNEVYKAKVEGNGPSPLTSHN
jgi:hypothetical protein